MLHSNAQADKLTRMERLRLELTPVPTTDDPPLRSRAYQEDLRELEAALRAQGFEVSIIIELIEAAGWPPTCASSSNSHTAR
jgi:hypothetical protein